MIHAEANPFSAARLRPGNIPYRFGPADRDTDPQQLDQLMVNWQNAGRRGQIAGPHGCGKSTLACSLAQAIVADGNQPATAARTIVFRASQSRFGLLLRRFQLGGFRITDGQFTVGDPRGGRCLTIIDGLEAVPAWLRRLALACVSSASVGSIVTTHRPLSWLPLLITVEPNIDIFAALAHALAGNQFEVSDDQIQTAFLNANGNCREGLMNLYDLVEDAKQR